MRLAASIAPALALALWAAPGHAGLYEDFKAICRDTDASRDAAVAVAIRLGFKPASEKDARELAKDMPGGALLERTQGKDEVGLVVGAKREKQVTLDTCTLMTNRVPASEIQKFRTEFGKPTSSVLGQQVYTYVRTPSGDRAVSQNASGKAAAPDHRRFIVVFRMLGNTALMLNKPRQ